MPIWDSMVEGGNILPVSAFDESAGLYEDFSRPLDQIIGTSSQRESRDGVFKNGQYPQAVNVYWGDSRNGSHFANNNEQQFYRNPFGNDPDPLGNYEIRNGNLLMKSRRATAAEQATFAHYKGYHVTSTGGQQTVASKPNPRSEWDPVLENRDSGAVWRYEKYPADFISTMISTFGRYSQSFGRVIVRAKCASGGQRRPGGNPGKDYRFIDAYFAALIWALEEIEYGHDINGEPTGGASTHMPENEARGGVLPEIDGHENFSDEVSLAHQTLHYYSGGAQQQTPSSITRTADSRTNFQEYGWDLTPGKLGFIVNGRYTRVMRTPNSIAQPKPFYVRQDGSSGAQQGPDGRALTDGTRKNPDGSDFYMKWALLSNLAVSSNLSRSSYYSYAFNDDPNWNPDVGDWEDEAHNEIEYIFAAPLIDDNPDNYPSRTYNDDTGGGGPPPGGGGGSDPGGGGGGVVPGNPPITAPPAAPGYIPDVGEGVRFRQGHQDGIVVYELQDPKRAGPGRWRYDDYGDDAVVIGADNEPRLVLDVSAVEEDTARGVWWEADG